MNTKPDSQSSCTSNPESWLAPMLWGLGSGLTAAVATVLFLLTKMPLPLRATFVILPVVLALGYVRCVIGMFRRADELQRRIQLESLGFAFPATAILVMAVDLLQQAKILPAIHWSWGPIICAMCLLWFAGYLNASRRYR
jgi:hypothetical protein